MGGNLSIGGVNATSGSDRKPSDVNMGVHTDVQASVMNTVKDLKKAELQGENVPLSDEQLIKAIDRAIKAVQGTTTSLEFSVHEKTKQIMVKVIDNETGKVIREVPPEKTLDLVAKIWQMAGILVDERR